MPGLKVGLVPRLVKGGIMALLTCLLLGAGARAQETGLARVTFMPQWLPQAQFAGYYVAYAKGFYRQHRLEVKIMRGGPEWPASEMLAQGRVDFGTAFLAKGIEARAQGGKLVNIAQMVQRSALMLVAKKAQGVLRPRGHQRQKSGPLGG